MNRFVAIVLALLFAFAAGTGIVVIVRDRAVQKHATSTVLIKSLARLILDWSLSAKRLPQTLEETRQGAPWLDACDDPLKYRIVDNEKLVFALGSSCGGRYQEIVFQIVNDELTQLPSSR